MTRILNVVTNVSQYADGSHPTGLWLSELTHAWDVFAKAEFEQSLVSPAGGAVPLEPRSIKFPNYDKSARAWRHDPAKMQLLEQTASVDEVDPADYDAIFFTGGHAVMFDFTENDRLQLLTRTIFENGGVVGAVCPGYCGLLNTKLSDGSYLLAGRQITGFSWQEEELAGVAKHVPYNAEKLSRERGASYSKGLPFTPHAIVDGRLVTGQNPASATETAERVAVQLYG